MTTTMKMVLSNPRICACFSDLLPKNARKSISLERTDSEFDYGLMDGGKDEGEREGERMDG